MTREQAAREAKRRWGKKCLIRVYERMSSQERREAAMALVREARERRDAIDAEIKQRLEALDWYQALQAERKTCYRTISQHQGEIAYFKFSVGREMLGMFEVLGYGDTWEQAFGKAEGKSVSE